MRSERRARPGRPTMWSVLIRQRQPPKTAASACSFRPPEKAALLKLAPAKHAIQPPGAAGIGAKENQEKKQQGQVVELVAEVAPLGHIVAWFPPGGESE